MLTQLSTVKTRLAITDTASDTLLTSTIEAVTSRFDREVNRTFAPLDMPPIPGHA